MEAGKADRQLESWKEIATFFDRDEKTVRRWEKELGMPVHRFPGRTKARVYALPGELREWAKRPQPREAHVLEPFPLPDPDGQVEDSPSGPKLVLPFPSSGVESSAHRPESRRRSYLLLLVAALVVSLCSLWPALINTANGVANVERDHLNVAKILNLNFFEKVWNFF